MSEAEGVNQGLLGWSAKVTLALLVMTLWQAASGLGQVGYAPEGWSLAGSHARSGEITLLLSIAVPILVAKSGTQDSKLKGMAFGLPPMFLVQVGIAHMMEGMPIVGMLHAVLALGIMSHATILFKELRSAGRATDE